MAKNYDPATKQDVEDGINGVKDKLNDIMNILDEVMGEIRTVRDEQSILASQHGRMLDLEDKTEKLEKIHPNWQHSPV